MGRNGPVGGALGTGPNSAGVGVTRNGGGRMQPYVGATPLTSAALRSHTWPSDTDTDQNTPGKADATETEDESASVREFVLLERKLAQGGGNANTNSPTAGAASSSTVSAAVPTAAAAGGRGGTNRSRSRAGQWRAQNGPGSSSSGGLLGLDGAVGAEFISPFFGARSSSSSFRRSRSRGRAASTPEEVIAQTTQELQANPANSHARITRARAYIDKSVSDPSKMALLAKAVADYSRVIERGEGVATDAFYLRGLAYQKLGQVDKR